MLIIAGRLLQFASLPKKFCDKISWANGWIGQKDQVKIMIVLCLVFQQQGRVILSWNRDENKKLNFTWNSSDVKGAVGTDLNGLMYEKLVAEKLDAVKLWCIETMM